MLALTLLVRDEVDIVAANIDFHLAQGVDVVIATDNLSVDGTTDVLREYERQGVLHYLWEPDDDYAQATWVSRMARLASVEHGADWVINADADEFWWPREGDLASTLAGVPTGTDVVIAQRFDFVVRPDDDQRFDQRMRWRRTQSINHQGRPIGYKVAHRGHPEAEVSMGNHFALHPHEGEDLDDGRIEILHFPMRSYAQFTNKILKGGAAIERNPELAPEVGVVWRDMLELHRRGEFEAGWDEWLVDDAELAAAIDAGEVILDERLVTYLDGLAAARAAPPKPSRHRGLLSRFKR